MELAIAWFLTFAPLAISPGPANILFASSGSSFGIRETVPFWLGTNLICIIQSLAVGLGLGFLVSSYPSTINFIKYIGVFFLLYLAYKFFRTSVITKEAIKPLSFKDGVIVELLNVKYLMIPMIMFSQFYSPTEDGFSKIFFLTFALAVLTMASNFVWVVVGKALMKIIENNKNVQKLQGVIFGVLLCITALWLSLG